jgi:beta-glucosidase-like glycosyl hydrolase
MGLCVGNTGPANSVGFPPFCLQDGPLGIRFADHSTAFPAGLTIGATWNRDLMQQRGAAHGNEARQKGINVLLGPAMGPIGRHPAGGRNWEGFGSDPVLQAIAAAATIRGIQSEGVMATAKHYVGNEQEHFRQAREWGLLNALSSNIDDRTLHEVYAWPFAESVRAGVASVMCSYQMVNNSYACANSKLMNGILKDELGFQGFVQSDWLAQRSGVASALAGLDMTMPGDGLSWADGASLWGSQMTLAVLNGSLPMERLNDMVTRIVAAWYQVGQDTWERPPPEGKGGPNFSSWTDKRIGKVHEGATNSHETAVVNQFVDVQGNHSGLARQIAAEGTVLVKNEGVLPLDKNGGRSAKFNERYRVVIVGDDAGPGRGPNACNDRGCNEGTLAVGWGSGASEFPYLVDPFSAIKRRFNRDKVTVTGHLADDVTEELRTQLKEQDLCLVFANSDAGEGFISWKGVRGDRNDLNLQKGGDKLIKAVAQNCGGGQGDTVVVIHAVGPVIVEAWADLPGVKAIILANLPGEESGNALSDVLFGHVDASGRLPYTVGKRLEDYGPSAPILYYPNGIIPQANFDEGLYIDYRYFDKEGIEPRYPFGFGLSYTSFEYSSLTITALQPKSAHPAPRPLGLQPPSYETAIPDATSALFPEGFYKLEKYIYPYISSVKEVNPGKYPYPDGYSTPQLPSEAGGGQGGNPSLFETFAQVSLSVTNSGSRAGKDVVQLYISFPDVVVEPPTGELIDFPVKVLRNFEKVELQPGQEIVVELNLTRKDLSYWSVVQQNWVMPTEGEFKISVGRSSRNLPLEGTL